MMKILMAFIMTLPAFASAAVTSIYDYKSYDCKIRTGSGQVVNVVGNLMTLSIDEHYGRFFQIHLSVEKSIFQLQVLLEETANTAQTGEVILLQNLKVDEKETSVEVITHDVSTTETVNQDVSATCSILR
ncbi:hypothetical protein [Bdellovibrio sp. HCB288]|uniref:hypothetical protein n=1 Tax=Bdellovibrio sp. HCB288 TaxID=3394355 RepID=UPI0039B55CF2